MESDIYTLPMFSQAVIPIHGLAVNASDPALVLDIETIARIWSGKIEYWNHPSIASLNPVLAANGKLVGNITKVMIKSGQRQSTSSSPCLLVISSDP
jgi:ABC-type phosphate transport system substrate-binding protein